MISVFAATATELTELKPIRRGLIIGRYVVAALACTTLKNNIIAWHLLISDLKSQISNLRSQVFLFHNFRHGAGADRSASFAPIAMEKGLRFAIRDGRD